MQATTTGGCAHCRLLQPAGPGSHGGSDVEGAERRLDVSRHLYLHDLRQQVPGRRRKIGKKRFYLKVSSRLTKFIRHRYSDRYLPPGNEVWGKVIFSQACVIPYVLVSQHAMGSGCVSKHAPGGVWVGGVHPSGQTPLQADTPPLGRHSPGHSPLSIHPQADTPIGSGQYASILY